MSDAQVDVDARRVLDYLAFYQQTEGDSKRGHYNLEAKDLAQNLGLDPDRLNDAVDLLEENRLVEAARYLGTHPFAFHDVEATSRGRAQAQRLRNAFPTKPVATPPETSLLSITSRLPTSPVPVGSPFGFTDIDWEALARARDARTSLIVVLGHQWESMHFGTEKLRKNVGAMFEAVLAQLRSEHPKQLADVKLDYRPLRGGYGEHLFNEIARDIISADIAVFDTSDQNANVMIELGVALTWGIRTLPIRETKTQKPPSDISGQTWATYQDSGAIWDDSEHSLMLKKMVERVLRKKQTLRRP